MAPVWPDMQNALQAAARIIPRSLSGVQNQWRNPGDVLSVLLLLGGDVVQTAIAQLAGGPYGFCPVAFSFGWAAFALSAVLSSLDEGRLLPRPDKPSIVINGSNGISRPNQSWVLGRVLRDWKDAEPVQPEYSLCVSILRTDETRRSGSPKWDFLMTSGVVTILLQLGLALVPGILYEDWSILLTTGCGTILALGMGAMPEWTKEKWSHYPRLRARDKKGRRTSKTICLTPGNGSNRVIVITSYGDDLDLEKLASARFNSDLYTKRATIFFAVCWILLLFTISGIKENCWFLLMIGALGMIQNMAAAGLHRNTSSIGIHLKPDTGDVIGEPKQGYIYPKNEGTMAVLMKVEERLPGIGASLLEEFFRTGRTEEEEKWWKNKAEERQQKKRGQGADAGQAGRSKGNAKIEELSIT